MKKLWIYVAFLAIHGNSALADDSDEQTSLYYDDYNYEYNNFDSTHYPSGERKDNILQKILEQIPKDLKFKTTESDQQYEDYQVEDNRSELSEDSFNNAAEDTYINSEKITTKQNKIEDQNTTEIDHKGIDLTTLDYDNRNIILSNSAKNYTEVQQTLKNTVDSKESNENFEKKIFADTKSILNKENENSFSQGDFVDLNTEKISTLTEILEETRRLLRDSFDTMEETNKNDDEGSFNHSYPILEFEEEVSKETLGTVEEKSVDQVIEDFKADLRKLREKWSKLNVFTDDNLEWSDEYEAVNKINFSEENKDINNVTANHNNKEEHVTSTLEVFPDDSQLNKETVTSHPISYLDDALPATESEKTNSDEDVTLPTLKTQEIILRDVLHDIEPIDRTLIISQPESSSTTELTETSPKIIDLSKSEAETLMSNLVSQNKFIFSSDTQNDISNANFVWLTVDSPTIITSPGYPSPYPPNNVTEWMITGDGMGIEFNLTDFAVNGHVGDYLLLKPGGEDASGDTGLLFSYILRNERRFRFLDVDKMFVRFEAKPGPQVLRGFSFSVRMVSPRPGALQPEPEPEPVFPDPPATITLNLGGVSLEGFLHIKEQFRQIIAQMAATYITNNNIDPGINTTLELTQIRSRALCFHNWPKFEQCAEVRFGVPLVYEDDQDVEREPRLNAEDLTIMWETYSQLDPYATNLRSLGITEYQVPNDRGILIVWLVVSGGVVISMIMLAFALWRFSCFENYTRMPAFSDTDSVKEKRNLDLYPTPHQTLPPLYTETDYNWADAKYDDTKADVTGYSNKSYMRDDPYNLDSDEDIVPVSARNTGFSPRDIYSV